MSITQEIADRYISNWEKKGYNKGIPEEVPQILMKENLAPSYKAICLAILNNDLKLESISSGRNWRKDIKKINEMFPKQKKQKELI
jgi:predicted phosphoadenosine phosphosulfate sulfurtransferase